jgi:hypothetical protein
MMISQCSVKAMQSTFALRKRGKTSTIRKDAIQQLHSVCLCCSGTDRPQWRTRKEGLWEQVRYSHRLHEFVSRTGQM